MTPKKCRFPQCATLGTKKSGLRRGLCNKHRKWAEKKIIDWDTCEILDQKRVPKGREWFSCKIKRCIKKHKALGFCSNHYRSFKIYKTIDRDGYNISSRRKYDYSSRCIVINCFRRTRLSKGFCLYHYDQYRKKIINENGFSIRKLKKISKYPEKAKCKTPSCKNKPRSNWFCINCASKFNHGTIDSKGIKTSKHFFVNKGKKCLEKNCSNPAKAKGLCTLHYSRKINGYLGPSFYKNVGQKCSYVKCNHPAVCRAMCGSHYRKALRKEKGLKTVEFVNKGRMCRVDCCTKKAYSRILCESHYLFFKRENRLDIIENMSLRPIASLKRNITIDPSKCFALGCSDKPILNNLCSAHLAHFRMYQPEVLDLFIEKLGRYKKIGSALDQPKEQVCL